jgi:hypothetical protein
MDEFLKTVEHSGPQLTSGIKGDWQGLYQRFFRSSNFEGWYKLRQQVLHLEAICEAVSTTNYIQMLHLEAICEDISTTNHIQMLLYYYLYFFLIQILHFRYSNMT